MFSLNSMVFVVVAVSVSGTAIPQNTLSRCPPDLFVDALFDQIRDCPFVRNQVACVVNPDLKLCESLSDAERWCPGCYCCDSVGIRLRLLAPKYLENPDPSSCGGDGACKCQKKDGQRVLNQLQTASSSDNISYKPLYDLVTRHFEANKLTAFVSYTDNFDDMCLKKNL